MQSDYECEFEARHQEGLEDNFHYDPENGIDSLFDYLREQELNSYTPCRETVPDYDIDNESTWSERLAYGFGLMGLCGDRGERRKSCLNI